MQQLTFGLHINSDQASTAGGVLPFKFSEKVWSNLEV